MRKERNSGEIRSFEKERESGVVFSEFHVKCEIGGRGGVEMEYTIRVCLLTMYNRTKYGKSVEKGRSWLFVSNIRYSYMLYSQVRILWFYCSLGGFFRLHIVTSFFIFGRG